MIESAHIHIVKIVMKEKRDSLTLRVPKANLPTLKSGFTTTSCGWLWVIDADEKEHWIDVNTVRMVTIKEETV